ncbi:MAG: hypothetical protein GWN00_34545 [Aliifodinibius sp.]|nr:hypothetical protein [Fodinibius sp.]NIV15822.1 hypothetical protein [Fodinibius sp.]NIY29723.1 hypothetical protein [Fodinibius sp.]
MDWQNDPPGMIRHDELLNALLALWKTQQNIVDQYHQDEFFQMYTLGFEASLDAIAQIAGLTDLFEAGKSTYQAKLKAKINTNAKLIEGRLRDHA